MAGKKSNLVEKLLDYSKPTTGQFVLLGFGLVLALAVYFFLQGFVSCWSLTSLPGMPPAACPNKNIAPTQVVTNEQGTPVVVQPTTTPDVSIPQAELPAPWDGASRVSILVMGYDYGEWSSDRKCPCRTDTMIVLTIDPVSKTAAMVSVPRDMWVNIPGFGYNKINSANAFGDGAQLPGGGPELARKTVEAFLGVPIQYYVLIDFNAFTTVVDTIAGRQGICLVIPYDITIDPLGKKNTEDLKAGPDCFNGAETLAYARTRHTENEDVDRSGRQMQVILAIRDAVLRPGNWPNLVLHSTDLYNEVSAGVKTNFASLTDALQLAQLATQIPLDSIQQRVIDYTMMAPGKTDVNGITEDILRPFPDKIREVVDQLFGTGSMKPMASANPSQISLDEAKPLMQQESASVIVVNASGVDGIASKTADYLKSQGMNVTNYGNTGDYPDLYKYPPLPGQTLVILHGGKVYAMEYLMKLMNTDKFILDFDPAAPADIILAVGADWANNNPMP
jgi:polyisoprenyl-teichoic acid--peptidoglycan teichoic acid transferase